MKYCDIATFNRIDDKKTSILRGKSLVSNFDQPDYYNAKAPALDVPLYLICKVNLFLILKRNSGSYNFNRVICLFRKLSYLLLPVI